MKLVLLQLPQQTAGKSSKSSVILILWLVMLSSRDRTGVVRPGNR